MLVFVIGAAPVTSEILTSKKFCYTCCLYSTLLPQAWAAYKTGLGCPLRESHSPEDLSGLPPLRDPGLAGAVAGQGYHCGSDEVVAGIPATVSLGPDGDRSPPCLPL